MKQLFLTTDGRIVLNDVPRPTLRSPGAITQTKFSAISAGTEGTIMRARRRNPDPKSSDLGLGYSNAGVILETGKGLDGFRPGDSVACEGGDYATHAQECFISKNLIARCPAHVDLREAAFSTLGAIALQGLRRANVELGETVAILGLGMIGQLAVQIAKAAGARVVAADINEARLKLASRLGADVAVQAQARNAVEVVREFTAKHGVDAAIITASTPGSSAPLVQGMEMARHRGRVVIVGNVLCEFPRDLWFYKDLDLRIATAYGPGRYDPQYEEHGHDYPIGYVRWTEGRNLQEFVRLLGDGLVKVAPLITHEFPFERAADAYETIMEKPDDCLGVVLRY